MKKYLKINPFFMIGAIVLCQFSTLISVPKIVNQKISGFKSQHYSLKLTKVVTDLKNPWGLTWINSKTIKGETETKSEFVMLVAERNGTVWLIKNNKVFPIKNLPNDVAIGGQGGWFDLLSYKNYIFLSYANKVNNNRTTALIRFQLMKNQTSYVATKITPWFKESPALKTYVHFGGKLTSDGKYIFLSLGDRGRRRYAQDKTTHVGGIVRLFLDQVGPVAKNPFKLKELYSYGHRSVQGIFFDHGRKILWQTEHGPQGGDELNIIKAGKNYGWPAISYGKEYGSGTPVSKTTSKAGMEQPIKYWDPSPALSGLLVYRGKEFPKWTGQLFLGSLKYQRLYRLKLDNNNKVIEEEQLLKYRIGRIRTLRIGPETAIYILTDHNPGQIIKLTR